MAWAKSGTAGTSTKIVKVAKVAPTVKMPTSSIPNAMAAAKPIVDKKTKIKAQSAKMSNGSYKPPAAVDGSNTKSLKGQF